MSISDKPALTTLSALYRRDENIQFSGLITQFRVKQTAPEIYWCGLDFIFKKTNDRERDDPFNVSQNSSLSGT